MNKFAVVGLNGTTVFWVAGFFKCHDLTNRWDRWVLKAPTLSTYLPIKRL